MMMPPGFSGTACWTLLSVSSGVPSNDTLCAVQPRSFAASAAWARQFLQTSSVHDIAMMFFPAGGFLLSAASVPTVEGAAANFWTTDSACVTAASPEEAAEEVLLLPLLLLPPHPVATNAPTIRTSSPTSHDLPLTPTGAEPLRILSPPRSATKRPASAQRSLALRQTG